VEFVASRPTFDAKKLKEGMAVQVTARNAPAVRGSYSWPALVVEVRPFEMVLAVVDDDADSVEWVVGVTRRTINIDDVVSGQVKIQRLVPGGEAEK
jgi:hypothetical protein